MTKATTKVVRGARPEPIWEKKGGQAVSGLGGALVLGGLALAVALAVGIQWLFPAGILGFLVAGVVLLATVPLGIAFRRAAKKLIIDGNERERTLNLETINQLAQATGRGVTVEELAHLGGVSEERADVILTTLANAGDLRLEVSDEGELFYHPKVLKLRVESAPVPAINYGPNGPPSSKAQREEESAEELARASAKRGQT